MDTEYNDSLCLTEQTEGGLHNTVINLQPFVFDRETIDVVLIVKFLWLCLSPLKTAAHMWWRFTPTYNSSTARASFTSVTDNKLYLYSGCLHMYQHGLA